MKILNLMSPVIMARERILIKLRNKMLIHHWKPLLESLVKHSELALKVSKVRMKTLSQMRQVIMVRGKISAKLRKMRLRLTRRKLIKKQMQLRLRKLIKLSKMPRKRQKLL
jgi:molecular chaperone DnaK (HSP70)